MAAPDDWKRDRIGSALAGTNPTVLAKLPQSFAVIGDTQFLPGYCVLLVDDPDDAALGPQHDELRARIAAAL